MTGIKLCGLSLPSEIGTVNRLKPDYIGFVFAKKSRRYITEEKAAELKRLLTPEIKAVGVFINEDMKTVARLLKEGVIDIAQLHGTEDAAYVKRLREITGKAVIQAFCIGGRQDAALAESSVADYVILDSGAGSGRAFAWELAQNIKRPYFLAGGLTPENVEEAIERLHPYAVDVSSGIETDGVKDQRKMAAFVAAVRKEGKL